MPTTYNMKQGEDLYRGIYEYDYEPFEWVRDPNTNRSVRRVTGPVETGQFVRGPYKQISHVKATATRERQRTPSLRLVRVEKVSGWEEVEIV